MLTDKDTTIFMAFLEKEYGVVFIPVLDKDDQPDEDGKLQQWL
jgi:hypothetical protein